MFQAFSESEDGDFGLFRTLDAFFRAFKDRGMLPTLLGPPYFPPTPPNFISPQGWRWRPLRSPPPKKPTPPRWPTNTTRNPCPSRGKSEFGGFFSGGDLWGLFLGPFLTSTPLSHSTSSLPGDNPPAEKKYKPLNTTPNATKEIKVKIIPPQREWGTKWGRATPPILLG